MTGSDGKLRIDTVYPPASHSYQVTASGYSSKSGSMSIGASSGGGFTVRLTKSGPTSTEDTFKITEISRVYYDPLKRDIVDVTGTVKRYGNEFEVVFSLKNKRGGFYQTKIYRAPTFFTSENLAYQNTLWPSQTLTPVVRTPKLGEGSQVCIDVELDLTLEAVRFLVDIVLPVPANPLDYGEQFMWLKGQLVSHMIGNGLLPSDYEGNPDGTVFLSKFSDLCSQEPTYVIKTFAEFAKNCYLTFEMDGLSHAIEDFASKIALPYKLARWDIHVLETPATEIIYVTIGKGS